MAKILVIDDDLDVLEVVQLVLEHKGFEVMASSNPLDVITKIEEGKPDAVLLDIQLGLMDGRDICRDVKKKYRDLPVILFSANINYKTSFEEYEADGFIAKPFDIDMLADTLSLHIA